MKSKQEVLQICNKLKKEGLVIEIKETKYAVKCLVPIDDDFQEDSMLIRDRIKKNFIKKGYIVNILGSYWVEIIFEDVKTRIDDCFNI